MHRYNNAVHQEKMKKEYYWILCVGESRSGSRFVPQNWPHLTLKWHMVDLKSTCYEWSDLTWPDRNVTNLWLEIEFFMQKLCISRYIQVNIFVIAVTSVNVCTCFIFRYLLRYISICYSAQVSNKD